MQVLEGDFLREALGKPFQFSQRRTLSQAGQCTGGLGKILEGVNLSRARGRRSVNTYGVITVGTPRRGTEPEGLGCLRSGF